MNTGEKEIFLPIDGAGEMRERYCEILEDPEKMRNHAVIIYGDTGCGKKCFSNECARQAKEKNENIIEINMLENLRKSNWGSEEKFHAILELIVDGLGNEESFEDLEGICHKPEIFKNKLWEMLEKQKKVLLLRFPKIEVFEEIDKYYNSLFNKNIIMYFIMEKSNVVNECRKKLDGDIEYFECMRLKKGDGKLIIDNYFSGENEPRFKVEDIESYLAARPLENKATVKEFKKLCDVAYKYAKKEKISCITTVDIFNAVASKGMI